MGPLEFVVIGFDNHHFTGEILPQLRELRKQGTIRIVDITFIRKDEQGKIHYSELSDISDRDALAFQEIVDDLRGLLTVEDIRVAAQELPVNSAAALVLFEHTWAISLQDAIKRANGQLLAGGLVNKETLERVSAELTASGKTELLR